MAYAACFNDLKMVFQKKIGGASASPSTPLSTALSYSGQGKCKLCCILLYTSAGSQTAVSSTPPKPACPFA